jgi:hypothetical protein
MVSGSSRPGRRRAGTMNPNDEVRRQILRYFYDRNANATSKTGKKGTAAKISDVKAGLKALHGLTQPQVMSNLTYLIDMDWVKTFEIQKQFEAKGGTTIPSSVTWYEITAAGIDKIDGESEFTSPSRFEGVNIQATGTNVITMGNGNVVNVEHRELHAELSTLRDRLTLADGLSEGAKLEVVADIESLKDQLAKPAPNPTVVKALWSGIEKAAAIAGLAELAITIAPHVQHLVH